MPQTPLDRRDFLKSLIGGAAALPMGLGFLPTVQAQESAPPVSPAALNVRDFGAAGDGQTDDTQAFFAAVDAVNTFGGGTIYIPSGTYILRQSIWLLSNTTVYGDGIGATVLKLADGVNEDVIGLLRTSGFTYHPDVYNVRISDLTLDGNRANQTEGEQFGFFCGAKSPQRHYQITCWRVEIKNFRGYGFDPHEWTERLYLIECISHDNGRDGITLDGIVDGMLRSCITFNNDRHGYNIITGSHNVVVEQCIAHNNGENGFTIQNDSYSVQVTGCLSYGNRSDGIYCIGVNDNIITNNQVALNLENGIRIRGCARTTVTANRLRDNSQSEHDRFSEIILDNDETHASVDTAVMVNHVTCTGDIRARYGIRETAGDGDIKQERNAFIANKVSGGATSDYGISGSDSIRDLGA